MSMKTLALSLVAAGGALLVLDASAADFCATPGERTQVADALRKGAKMLPLLRAPAEKITERKFMSARGDDHRDADQPSQFPTAWDLMRTWKYPQFTFRMGENLTLVGRPRQAGGPGGPRKGAVAGRRTRSGWRQQPAPPRPLDAPPAGPTPRHHPTTR